LSGCISPFAKTEKLWFDARSEAENQEYDIYKDTAEYFKEHDDGRLHVFIKADTPDEYYEALKKIRESANEYIVELPYAQDEEASLTEDEIIEL